MGKEILKVRPAFFKGQAEKAHPAKHLCATIPLHALIFLILFSADETDCGCKKVQQNRISIEESRDDFRAKKARVVRSEEVHPVYHESIPLKHTLDLIPRIHILVEFGALLFHPRVLFLYCFRPQPTDRIDERDSDNQRSISYQHPVDFLEDSVLVVVLEMLDNTRRYVRVKRAILKRQMPHVHKAEA